MSLLLQLLVVYSPLNAIFKVIPITLIDWAYILIVSAILFMLGKVFNLVVGRITNELD